ncbi:MAG TPA: ADP-ribosylglycohydrolase family protein, partial [Candidatus Limnocylindria bacterium]|nr:ADP-ribosylglycohydrolase family protein [Candidatus Limnocylindria bacterium]
MMSNIKKYLVYLVCAVVLLGGVGLYAGNTPSAPSSKNKFVKKKTFKKKKVVKKKVIKKKKIKSLVQAKKSKKKSVTAEPAAQLSRQDRIEGSIIGGALGDAMGNPTEFVPSVEQMYTTWPEGIRSFSDFKSTGIVPYTDDTAMTKVTMAVLNDAKNNNWDQNTIMSRLAVAYVQDMQDPNGWAKGSRAPGAGCLRTIRELAAMRAKDPQPWVADPLWWQAGTREYSNNHKSSGGCGSVMRAHPVGLAFADLSVDKAATLAAQHSKITHGHPWAIAASAAMAAAIAHILRDATPERVLEGMVAAAAEYDEQTAKMIEEAIQLAHTNRKMLNYSTLKEQVLYVHTPVFTKYQGWLAHDAIAAVAYIYALYPADIRKAIYLGVHTPGDSDSIASMAGALVGATVGYQAVHDAFAADIARLENAQELLAVARGQGWNWMPSQAVAAKAAIVLSQQPPVDYQAKQQQAKQQAKPKKKGGAPYVPGVARTGQSYQVDNPNGPVTITLVLDGDITKQRGVDAIVNAANESLIGSAGIAKAIQDAAGEKEFRDYVERRVEVIDGKRGRVGEVVYTPAFNLTKTMGNKWIIHTVGPASSMPHANQLLANCYRNSYELANALGLRSIAIGTISTGIFGYPRERAVPVVVKTTIDFATSPDNKHVKEIRLLIWGEDY